MAPPPTTAAPPATYEYTNNNNNDMHPPDCRYDDDCVTDGTDQATNGPYSCHCRILIVGAGYAGLTVASCLLVSTAAAAAAAPEQSHDDNNDDNNNNNNLAAALLDMDVVDRLHAPDGESMICGMIHVPAASALVQRIQRRATAPLSLSSSAGGMDNAPPPPPPPRPCPRHNRNSHSNSDSNNSASYDYYDEQALLDYLRQGIVQPYIYYRHAVQEIISQVNPNDNNNGKSNDHNFSCCCQFYARIVKRRSSSSSSPNGNDNDDDNHSAVGDWWGPYHTIVLAQGAARSHMRIHKDNLGGDKNKNGTKNHTNHNGGSMSRHDANTNTNAIFVIGDAAPGTHPWWDLGRQRIRQGANVAMQQGAQLADALVVLLRQQQQSLRTKDGTTTTTNEEEERLVTAAHQVLAKYQYHPTQFYATVFEFLPHYYMSLIMIPLVLVAVVFFGAYPKPKPERQ